MDETPIKETKWALRKLNKLDFIILALLCLITIGIALADFYNQKEIEQRCLTDCNNHWVEEYKTKCAGPWGSPNLTNQLRYDYPIT